MSLLDDKKKAVELFVENLYSGVISSDVLNTSGGWLEEGKKAREFEARAKLLMTINSEIEEWLKLRESKTYDQQFATATASLFKLFLDSRVGGVFKGSFKQISQLEAELKKCREDNEQMAKELSTYRTQEASRKPEGKQYG